MSYWQALLKDSKYIDAGAYFRPELIPDSLPVHFRIEKETLCPKLSKDITTASFMNAVWAIFLSQILNQNDVIFGRLVNGRNAAIPGIEEVVGSYINIVPVRVDVKSHHTLMELILAVQEQFICLGEADSLGFNDIFQNCTDWPAGSKIYSCTQHQIIDEDLAFEIEGFTGRLRRFENRRRLPYFLYMISFPRGTKLGVQIFAHSHMMAPEIAQGLLDSFCPLVEKLAAGLDASSPIVSLVDGFEAPRLQRQEP